MCSLLLQHTKFLSNGVRLLRSRYTTPTRITPIRALCQSSAPNQKEASPPKPSGILDRLWGFDSNAAPLNTNRWLMLAPAFFTHMSLGSPYAWSLIADVLTREKGFVASSTADWTLMETALPLSIVFVMLGVSASVLGKWQARVGIRKAMGLASVCFGGGLLVSAAAINIHNLPLLYAGYGVMAGTAIGLAYTPPIQALMQWFPDKKGLASGMVIAGFGSGALLFTPCMQYLMNTFKTLPTYLGPSAEVSTSMIEGRRMAEILVDGSPQLVEVVEALGKDLAKLPYAMSEGIYVVGSGATGAAEALAVIGGVYFAVILGSSLLMRTPHAAFIPPAATTTMTPTAAAKPAATTTAAPSTVLGTHHFADVNEAIRTPQFHLLGLTFVCLAAGGLGLFSVAKPMMSEVFSGSLFNASTAQYSMALLGAGVGGRFVFGALSDHFGGYRTILLLSLASIPLYASMPTLIHSSMDMPLFASTTAAAALAGGIYSVLPAYQAELYGQKHVGSIYGMTMLYGSLAALIGPYTVTKCKILTEIKALKKIAATVSPEQFQETFGASAEAIADLYYKHNISVAKLLTIAPPDTFDPTPYLYDRSLYVLSGMMVAAAVSHSLVIPYTPISAVEEENRLREEQFSGAYPDRRESHRRKKKKE